jgi:hypothetical protein
MVAMSANDDFKKFIFIWATSKISARTIDAK